MALTVLVVTLIVLLIIGLPLPYSLGGAAVAGLLAMNEGIPLTVIPQRFVAGIDSFAFMAIPFFLLLGELMNAAGITRRIIRLSNALVGHLPGGLAQVNVVSSMFFGLPGPSSRRASCWCCMASSPMCRLPICFLPATYQV